MVSLASVKHGSCRFPIEVRSRPTFFQEGNRPLLSGRCNRANKFRKRLPRQELAAASLGPAPAGSFASKLFAFFSTHCQHLGAIFRDSKDPGRRSSMTALFLQRRVSSTYARLHFRNRSCWARFGSARTIV